jgi:hypothetical protein
MSYHVPSQRHTELALQRAVAGLAEAARPVLAAYGQAIQNVARAMRPALDQHRAAQPHLWHAHFSFSQDQRWLRVNLGLVGLSLKRARGIQDGRRRHGMTKHHRDRLRYLRKLELERMKTHRSGS